MYTNLGLTIKIPSSNLRINLMCILRALMERKSCSWNCRNKSMNGPEQKWGQRWSWRLRVCGLAVLFHRIRVNKYTMKRVSWENSENKTHSWLTVSSQIGTSAPAARTGFYQHLQWICHIHPKCFLKKKQFWY